MKLYIMRHGQAQLKAATDTSRQLTEHGFKEAEQMASWFASQNFPLTHLLVSPYIRAQQTAQTFTDSLKSTVVKKTSNVFEPNADANQAHDFIDAIISLEACDGLLVVAHMPLVSYLVGALTAGCDSPIFQTGSIAVIEYDEKLMRGQLLVLTAPSDLI